MAVTIEEFQSFRRFADDKLRTSGAESLEKLVQLWRAEHPVKKDSAAVNQPGGKAEAEAAVAAKRKAVPYM